MNHASLLIFMVISWIWSLSFIWKCNRTLHLHSWVNIFFTFLNEYIIHQTLACQAIRILKQNIKAEYLTTEWKIRKCFIPNEKLKFSSVKRKAAHFLHKRELSFWGNLSNKFFLHLWVRIKNTSNFSNVLAAKKRNERFQWNCNMNLIGFFFIWKSQFLDKIACKMSCKEDYSWVYCFIPCALVKVQNDKKREVRMESNSKGNKKNGQLNVSIRTLYIKPCNQLSKQFCSVRFSSHFQVILSSGNIAAFIGNISEFSICKTIILRVNYTYAFFTFIHFLVSLLLGAIETKKQLQSEHHFLSLIHKMANEFVIF